MTKEDFMKLHKTKWTASNQIRNEQNKKFKKDNFEENFKILYSLDAAA